MLHWFDYSLSTFEFVDVFVSSHSLKAVYCVESGLVTPSGVTSVPIGVETPDMIELRKRRIEDAMEQGGDTPAVPYAVLPEKKSGVAGAMMGSTHVYDIAAVCFLIIA